MIFAKFVFGSTIPYDVHAQNRLENRRQKKKIVLLLCWGKELPKLCRIIFVGSMNAQRNMNDFMLGANSLQMHKEEEVKAKEVWSCVHGSQRVVMIMLPSSHVLTM